MKNKLLVVVLFFTSLFGLLILIGFKPEDKKPKIETKKLSPVQKQKSKIAINSTSIFVPFWSLNEVRQDLSKYNLLIYFGISASYDGINKFDSGFGRIEKFLSQTTKDKEKYLTLRMIDDDINSYVLKNSKVQQKIINETLEILNQFNFDGLVLDLEISSLINKDVKGQINTFVQLFYSETNRNYRKFYLTIYGDTFFRGRPYDTPFLAKNSDGIMIMAYDFHKSRGEPGPNFPYASGAKYQYDFKNMIYDFSQFVAKEKITVVFGMFGYDWLVDEKKRPIRQAKALSYNEIKTKFLGKCEFKNCIVKRDGLSKESEVNYVISSDTPDEQNIYRIDYHIVWFEDEESVRVKTEFLQEQGIANISYWAYGYF